MAPRSELMVQDVERGKEQEKTDKLVEKEERNAEY